MKRVSLELLEILDVIDRRGSFAAAADELNRVPSALSYTIQKHEDALGLSLFQRQGRRSVFTPAARLLLERGRILLDAAHNLADDVCTLAMGWEPRIKIAVDSLVPMDAVMGVIAEFLQQYPEIEIDVGEELLGGTWEALLEERADLLVGGPEPKPQGHGIRTEHMGVVERVFAVNSSHPLTKQPQPLTTEIIARYRSVVAHDSSRSSVPRSTRLFNDDKRFYVQNVAQKVIAQRAGIGVGFLPRRMIEEDLAAGTMVALEVDGVGTRDHLCLAWKLSNKGQGLKRLVAMLMAARIAL